MLKNFVVLLTVTIFTSSCLLSPKNYIPIKREYFETGISFDSSDTITASPDSSLIKVLVWNIHKEGNYRDWVTDFQTIYEDKNPDIIILQEARLNTGMEYALKTLRAKEVKDKYDKIYWIFSPNLIERKHDVYSGVLTASKLKPEKWDALITEGLEPYVKTPKTALFTKYKISNSTELLVVNIHGINMVGYEEFTAQITAIIEEIEKHNGPIIFAGDFNTRSKKRLKFLKDELNVPETGLDLVRVAYNEKDEKKIKTWFVLPTPLDHIFYSQKWLEVKQDSTDVLEDIKSSDHKALFVEFKVKGIN
ncbi:MAG: endonuclease/exonuclease/phosphatase family protein [Candidatus Scalindua sp. AMX11]|nr:MAG: endonuclease/exonuclease/phosphatase family protein [Candidatus Scalindua sp.]TDE66531.1 MAG: endonuclease/exonuclease/phosphatase family protein [Candidatus Scalindua sp. AMX11]GJQ58896.1 MAG: EEP domain-containing protein [Candidatus Scalindua sp.]